MTPLVLLPGMMCDERLFASQINELSKRREVHFAKITDHETISELASDVLNNAPPVFALAGLSMGGIVAMEIVSQAPERVERLALLDTNPLAELPDVLKRRGPQIDAIKNGQLKEIIRDEMKPNYLFDGVRKTEILKLCMDMALDIGPDAFIRQSIALRDRVDQKNTLGSYKRPALVLCGRHDVLCPLERHELMHTLLENSKLEIIEDAGHLPTLEQPKITTMALASWLEDT
ncbi:alpha/beta hydrolase [Amylibacter sp.]|jgi:pimeloyl-ACP methyl ester carboxylesterase|nr:hydrolase, alpha/beta fold family protein [Rhodobacterales bacterium HTCC2255]MBT3952711.1 alpha/beta fold hydrolase [Rhodobacterales bacterium]MCO4795765.1 alpha/beta fold hydrolase [Amylibacter sp.]MDC3289757.1 alpha/beta hydrolase [bacterium]MBT4132925.1 alpha/beta fold hydrolase [Rhodobacterales bacterium]|tara:strand:+ start:870 stop:1565 length:696 start_codon:yes stop_codon:yes gene_type:complete